MLAAAPFVIVVLFRSELDTLFATMDSTRPSMDWMTLAGFGQALACPLLGWLFWRVWRTPVPVVPLEEPVASVPEGLPRRARPDRVSTPSPPPRQKRPGWTSLALSPCRSSLRAPSHRLLRPRPVLLRHTVCRARR